MKIDDSTKKTPGIGTAKPQARSGKTAETAGVDKAPADNVTLSAKAQALSAQTGSTGVFDSTKVSAIKAAIANGQFQVNAERVADGLIDSVKELISTRKG